MWDLNHDHRIERKRIKRKQLIILIFLLKGVYMLTKRILLKSLVSFYKLKALVLFKFLLRKAYQNKYYLKGKLFCFFIIKNKVFN